jgi:hypothetical protein
MATTSKRSFTSFVRPSQTEGPHTAPQITTGGGDQEVFLASDNGQLGTEPDRRPRTHPNPELPETALGGNQPDAPERTRIVTTTGRVRTYTASRNLPGVTLRLTEDRWERLKMLSIQERRPIQEILGEALDGYMRGRGLRW